MSKLLKITSREMEWIDSVVDHHKMIRSETTRMRVKILMQAAMYKILEQQTLEQIKKKVKKIKKLL
jgi:hypothetical protein